MGVAKGCLGTFGGLVAFFIGLPVVVVVVIMVRAEMRDPAAQEAGGGALSGTIYSEEIAAAAREADAVGQVRELQRALAARGYDPGPADGQLGEQTQAAIRAFERDNGLEETGQPGLRVRVLLSLQ